MIDDNPLAHRNVSETGSITEIETTLHLPEGLTIFVRAWQPPRPKRVIICVQGLGGHGGYYKPLAGQLAQQGTIVVAPDLRGHGRSAGRRGDIDSFARYLEDVAATAQWVDKRWPGKPLHLLGESMGSSIALQYVAHPQYRLHPAPIAGLILVSPVLRPAIRPTPQEVVRYVRALLTMPTHPAISVTGREELGCREPAFNAQLRADPLFVRQVSARFLYQLTKWLRQSRRRAAHISVPLLILRGECDAIAHPSGISALLRQSAVTRHQMVIFPEAYHCLLYDPATPSVVQTLQTWLEACDGSHAHQIF